MRICLTRRSTASRTALALGVFAFSGMEEDRILSPGAILNYTAGNVFFGGGLVVQFRFTPWGTFTDLAAKFNIGYA